MRIVETVAVQRLRVATGARTRFQQIHQRQPCVIEHHARTLRDRVESERRDAGQRMQYLLQLQGTAWLGEPGDAQRDFRATVATPPQHLR